MPAKHKVFPVRFGWENLSYTVKTSEGDKTLLHSMTGSATPGRVLAIMGPSGAGKTTFINACVGRLQSEGGATLGGCCTANDVVFSQRYRKLVSIVTQDDIVMGKDTPAEALYFSVRMRRGIGAEEATEAVTSTLEQLHLTGCSDTLIGVPGVIKGISGGERKRVNIATELIVDPAVMILDEPTTGLDSVNAANVGGLLKELSREGRTIMCTIHSPSSDLMESFDDIMLLSHGHVVFHGPLEDCASFFRTMGHPVPPHTNPSEHYMRTLQLPVEELQPLWEQFQKMRADASATTMQGTLRRTDPNLDEICAEVDSHPAIQFSLLLARSWRQNARNPATTVARLVQTVFFAVLFGLFFFNVYDSNNSFANLNGALFVLLINTLFTATIPGVVSFPAERAVFLREQASEMYGVVPYFAAKLLVDIPTGVPFVILFSCITYFMIRLALTASAFFIFLFILILLSICAFSLGLLASAFFPRADIAIATVPIIFLPMLLVAGLFSNTERLDPYWLWLNYLSIPRYAYMGLIVNQYRMMDTTCPDPGPCPILDGETAIRVLGFDWVWTQTVWTLIIITVGLWVLACLALWFNARKSKAQVDFEPYLMTRAAQYETHVQPAIADEMGEVHRPVE